MEFTANRDGFLPSTRILNLYLFDIFQDNCGEIVEGILLIKSALKGIERPKTAACSFDLRKFDQLVYAKTKMVMDFFVFPAFYLKRLFDH